VELYLKDSVKTYRELFITNTENLSYLNIVPLIFSSGSRGETPHGYSSLQAGLSKITKELTGVPGVYLLINSLDPSRFYIGSTVNLGRRLTEYHNLTTGTRTPVSSSEAEIAQTSADL
jgi:hypothetical protein